MSTEQRKWFFKGLPRCKASHPQNVLFRKLNRKTFKRCRSETVHMDHEKKCETRVVAVITDQKEKKNVRRRLVIDGSMSIPAFEIRAALATCDQRLVTSVTRCDHEWGCKRWRVITTTPTRCYNLTDVESVFNSSFIEKMEEQFGHVVNVSEEDFAMPRETLSVEVEGSSVVRICPKNRAGLLDRKKHSDPYEAFIFGDEEALNDPNVNTKLISLMRTIRSRRLKLVRCEELGSELVTVDDIEPMGAICVYGGNFIRPGQELLTRTHTKTLGRDVGWIDAPYPQGLPYTHWGAFANSSLKPNTFYAYVRWERKNHIRDIVILNAGRNGIGRGKPISANYRVEF